MECVFPRNACDSKTVLTYTIPRYGINGIFFLYALSPLGWFSGGEYQFYGGGKARNHRRDQRQSIHSPFLDAAAFTVTDPARTWASSCQLRSGVSRSPRARDRGHLGVFLGASTPRPPARSTSKRALGCYRQLRIEVTEMPTLGAQRKPR